MGDTKDKYLSILSALAILAGTCLGTIHTANAGFTEDGFYALDEIEVKAPGSDDPDSPFSLKALDYLKWSFQVTPGSFTMEELLDGIAAEDAQIILDEVAYEEAGITPEEAEADPKKKTAYLEMAKSLFIEDLQNTAAGPFLAHTWKWYENELDYEKNHASKIAELEQNKEEWIQAWIARKEFEAAFPEPGMMAKAKANAVGFSDDEKIGLHLSIRKKFKNAKEGGDLANPTLTYAQFLWHNREMEETFQNKKDEWIQNYLQQEVEPSESRRSAAERAYEAQLAALKASPFFQPNVADHLKNAENRNGSKNIFWFNVRDAYLQTLELENTADIRMQPHSTIGFDSYAIVDAKIEDALAALLYRNGIPIEGIPVSGNSIVYPVDDLFQYRRDQSWARDPFWGPNSSINHTIKWQANKSYVADLSDMYLTIVRGNPNDGYHIAIQFLGPYCPTDEGLDTQQCLSAMKSSFSLVILRPLPDGRTGYKMSSRSVGQNQQEAKSNDPDQGVIGDLIDGTLTGLAKMFSESSREMIGFNIENFGAAHRNYHSHVEKVKVGRAKLAGAAEVIEIISSENGYYVNLASNQAQKFASMEAAAESGYAPVVRGQGFYLADGELVHLAAERGSQIFRAQPYNQWSTKDLK